MNRTLNRLFLLLLLISCTFSARAQDIVQRQYHDQRICRTMELNDPKVIEEAWNNTLRHYPGIDRAMQKQLLNKGLIDRHIGDQELFWTYNWAFKRLDTVRAELKLIGLMTYIWVAVTEWSNGHVTMNEVNAIQKALEVSTPESSQDPARGILPIMREAYGDPPNIDYNFQKNKGDGKTHFLIYDIQDGWTGTGGFTAGYFFNADVDPRFSSSSNRRDLLYIDSSPGIYYNGNRRTGTVLTALAHELQHLIEWNYDPLETGFFNEGLSMYAEKICGYDMLSPTYYLNHTNVMLTSWSNELEDYSRAALWTLYTAEQFGLRYVKNLAQSPLQGINGFAAASSQNGITKPFEAIVKDFFTANWIVQHPTDTVFRYKSAFGARPVLKAEYQDPTVSGSGSLSPQSVEYISFQGSSNFRILLAGDPSIVIRAIESGPLAIKVRDVPLGLEYSSLDIGSGNSSIVFAIMNLNASAQASYSYSAVGELTRFLSEEKYDDGTPDEFSPGFAPYVGFGNNSPTRGFAVRFSPQVQGNVLKKARFYVAFDQEFSNGTSLATDDKDFIFHVWGDKNGRPGTDLIDPFLVTVDRAKYPQNAFVDVDLSAYVSKLSNLTGSLYLGFLEDDDDSVATYVGVDKTISTDYSYIFRGPTYVRSPNTWETLREVSAMNEGKLNGYNFMIRALFEYADSSTAPKISVGYLQNPLLTEDINVIAVSNDELRPSSVSGVFLQPAGSTTLKFTPMVEGLKAFIDTSQRLIGSGSVSFRVRAAKKFGLRYSDTLVSFTARLLKREEANSLLSLNNLLSIHAEEQTVSGPTYVTLFEGVHDPGAFPSTSALPRQVFTIGPAGLTLGKAIVMRAKAKPGQNNETFALRKGDRWIALPTGYDQTRGELLGSTERLGIIGIVKRSEALEEDLSLPATYILDQNYPNPFNPSTTIRYALPEPADVRIVVYDLLGRELKTLVNATQNPGTHSVHMDASALSTGIYLYRMTANQFSAVRKLVVVK
ncbi:MAG: T9SS type A sorting domain-containing protein [bacterium]